jgi:hypothetical protein
LTALLDVRLDDKYTKNEGRIHLTGVQALVRLVMEQRRRDLARGWNTAGYVTGLPGLAAWVLSTSNCRRCGRSWTRTTSTTSRR